MAQFKHGPLIVDDWTHCSRVSVHTLFANQDPTSSGHIQHMRRGNKKPEEKKKQATTSCSSRNMLTLCRQIKPIRNMVSAENITRCKKAALTKHMPLETKEPLMEETSFLRPQWPAVPKELWARTLPACPTSCTLDAASCLIHVPLVEYRPVCSVAPRS